MVDDDFVVDNQLGATSSGGGYTSSEYLDLGIPLSSSFGPVTNSYKPKMQDVVAHTSAAGDAHGGYNMTDFGGFTYNSFWTRHMVLLKEGGLIVLDSITPTALDGARVCRCPLHATCSLGRDCTVPMARLSLARN